MTTPMSVHYSSKRPDWETPPDLFAPLDAEFGFTLDAAASDTNTKVPERYFTEADDGLSQSWTDAAGAPATAYVNPPYGRTIGRWIEKAIREADHGATVVMLVPARTDSIWFQQLAAHATEIRLVAGRVTFEGATQPAPFPSAIVVLKPRPRGLTAGDETIYTLPKRHDPDHVWTRMWRID